MLKNKYFVGKYNNPEKFGGWFVGSFLDKNDPCLTEKVEVLYRENQKGYIQEPHYHKKKIEILIFLEGKAKYKINNEEFTLEKGDFLFADIDNVISGKYIVDSKVIAIHSPSLPEDKFIP